MSQVRTVARNTFWSAVEVASSFVISIAVTVVVARYFGPTRLGYFNYLVWLTSITGLFGSIGLVGTCRKYIGEYLGGGDVPRALSVYHFTFRVQTIVSVAIVAVCEVLALTLAPDGYKLIAAVLVAGIAPRIMAFIPSGANAAAEDNAGNVPGAVAGNLVQMFGTLLSIAMGWDLAGLAYSTLAGCVVELVLKSHHVRRRFQGVRPTPVDPELRRRLLVFSGQGLVLMALNLVVFDRSALVFLERLQRDPAELTFFSLGFGLIDKLLLGANVFAGAAMSRILAQFGTDRTRVPTIVGISGSYMLLISTPLLLGAAAVAPAAIPLVYGQQYVPAVPVFLLMALFSIPKVLFQPGQGALLAHEQQAPLVNWSLLCGIINILLNFWLIPRHGAKGAAVANGAAQAIASVGVWIMVARWHGVRLRRRMVLRNLASSLGMAAVAAAIVASPLPLAIRFLAGTSAGFVTYIILLRWTRALEAEDRQRLLSLEVMVPGPFRTTYHRLVDAVSVSAEG